MAAPPGQAVDGIDELDGGDRLPELHHEGGHRLHLLDGGAQALLPTAYVTCDAGRDDRAHGLGALTVGERGPGQVVDVVAHRLQSPGHVRRRGDAPWVHRAARGGLDNQADP